MATVAKQPGVWGIDLGQCALKAIRLEEVDGEIKATAFDYIEHPKILSQPDADPDQLTREALEKFLSRNDIKGDTIAVSVPGQSGLARFVKLPPVDEKKIPDIVRFEAKQQIPFPLEEVVWAYQRLGAGSVIDGMMLDTEIGLFAMKRDMVNRYLQHFKDVNVEVHVIQMAPLALCNFLAHDALGKGAAKAGEEQEGGGEKSCIVALDIGADNSNLVITDGERIIWQRPIPLGGNHFTRALTKDLKLTFAKAEHLKRNAVKSPDLKKILAALKPVLNDFVSEVQRSLGYFTNTHRDATIQYMIGLGNAFRLPGLQKYLQEKLQLEVRKLQKIERLAGEEAVTEAPQYVENVLSFAVAHGLALQGLKVTRLHTNLLPPEIQLERFIRAKKPWAAAAAAVLLLLVPPLLIGYAANYRTWTRDGVKKAVKNLEDSVKSASKDYGDFKKFQQDVEDSEKVVVVLGGGVKERLNWIHLNTVINESLPRPDGSRLLAIASTGARPKKDYFEDPIDGVSGKFAAQLHEKFRIKKAEAAAAGNALSEKEKQADWDNRKYLVQVNIEGITALYSDNLPGEFFTNPKITNHALHGMKLEQIADVRKAKEKEANLPKAGWIVEIRGYTYHGGKQADQGYLFVRDTLVENLNDMANIEPRDPKDPKKGRQLVPVGSLPADLERVLKFKGKEGDKDVDKPRLSHIFLYDWAIHYRPRGGDFMIIDSSGIATYLLAGGSGRGETKGPGAPGFKDGLKDGLKDGMKDGASDSAEGSRSSWMPPSGTVFADVFGGGARKSDRVPGGPGPGKVFDPKTKEQPSGSVQRLPPRTEFIILMIWQEPTTAEGAPTTGTPNEPAKK